MNNESRKKVNEEAVRLSGVGANIKAHKSEYAKQFVRHQSKQPPKAGNISAPLTNMGNPF